MIRVKAPRVRERVIQAQIRALLIAVGGRVYTIGRPPRGDAVFKGTGQTAGIPDLLVHLPQAPGPAASLAASGYGGQYPPHQVWIEVKGKGGRLRPEQASFRDFCLLAGIAHVVGGLDEVIAYLAARGYVEPGNVPHYRRKGTGHGEQRQRAAAQAAGERPDQEVQ